MLTWPHSGFHVHTAAWVTEEDRAFATRLARYCARPVALERLTYDRAAKAVTYRSDKSEGPTAGTETVDPLEFLARVLVHIPDKGHVTTRYCGRYANRPRGMRGKAAPAAADGPPAIVPAPRLAPTETTRRWANALGQPCSSRSSSRRRFVSRIAVGSWLRSFSVPRSFSAIHSWDLPVVQSSRAASDERVGRHRDGGHILGVLSCHALVLRPRRQRVVVVRQTTLAILSSAGT